MAELNFTNLLCMLLVTVAHPPLMTLQCVMYFQFYGWLLTPNHPDFYILNWMAKCNVYEHVALRCGCTVPAAEWLAMCDAAWHHTALKCMHPVWMYLKLAYVTKWIMPYVYECNEITFRAAVVDLTIQKHEMHALPFRIRYDFDSLSRLLNCFLESENMTNVILKSKQ